ncbi:hypothetical protein [Micromonospora sp. NPDC049799]|uniref:hypothetical protein n=1 Tax=Micromonospora sp. NPDC049799 TaxID=3154741 RepID=UPI0033CCF7BC
MTRLCLDRPRTLAQQREEYVGEWLPEPLLTSPDVAEDIEFAESAATDGGARMTGVTCAG